MAWPNVEMRFNDLESLVLELAAACGNGWSKAAAKHNLCQFHVAGGACGVTDAISQLQPEG
jgi:hypothetical protein